MKDELNDIFLIGCLSFCRDDFLQQEDGEFGGFFFALWKTVVGSVEEMEFRFAWNSGGGGRVAETLAVWIRDDGIGLTMDDADGTDAAWSGLGDGFVEWFYWDDWDDWDNWDVWDIWDDDH